MAMSKKEKDAFLAEVKKRGDIKKGEIISPGSVVRGVAKVAGKVAGKQVAKKVAANAGKKLTAAEKSRVKDVKTIVKGTKPGSLQKMMDKLPLEEKRAYSEALRKSIPAKKKAAVYKKTPVNVPARAKTKIMNSRGKIITIKEN
jgi:nicotinate-nucleotide pyrophosphorylase